MWEDTLIASNADLGRKLKSLYGGEVYRIGVSIIYEDPAGRRWLCRVTSSSGISLKHGPMYKETGCCGCVWGIWRKDEQHLFVGKDNGTADRIIKCYEGTEVARLERGKFF